MVDMSRICWLLGVSVGEWEPGPRRVATGVHSQLALDSEEVDGELHVVRASWWVEYDWQDRRHVVAVPAGTRLRRTARGNVYDPSVWVVL